MHQKIDRREWVRLLDRLELFEDAPLASVLLEAHKKLDELDQAWKDLEEAGEAIADLRHELVNQKPDEDAARLVHAQHSDVRLADLSLCPHPDCQRLWS